MTCKTPVTKSAPLVGPASLKAVNTAGPTNLKLSYVGGPTALKAEILTPPTEGPKGGSFKVISTNTPTRAKLNNGYFYNSRTSSLAGPFNTNLTTITSRDNSSEVYAVDQFHKVQKSDLLDLNNSDFKAPEIKYDYKTPFSTQTDFGFVGNKKGSFMYRNRYLESPFSDTVDGGGDVKDPMFFKNYDLSIAETHWMHFGSEAAEKEVYRVDLNFHKNSYGFLWLFVQNDEGQTSGQFKGEIDETIKVFTNLRGRRFRLKMFIGTHPEYPWAMREIAVGYNLGKSF